MDRERLWRSHDRQKATYRNAMKPVIMRAFEDQIQPLYDKIILVSDIRDLEIPPLNDGAIELGYQRIYQVTAADYAKRKRKQLRKSLKGDDEIFEDLILDHIRVYLRDQLGTEIKAVGSTSVKLIQQLLNQLIPDIMDSGVGGGSAQTMLRDRIKSEWHEMKYYRTERLVRTEINRASNWGALEGTKSIGAEMWKVWLSAFANESRPEHMAADGQRVDLYDAFEVGGEQLQYPCDPAGSAGMTINCLCSFYETLK